MKTLSRVVRSLRRRPGYAIGFLLAGVLGLSGNLYLDSLEGSLRASLGAKSRELLTADLSISVRRLTNEKERREISAFLLPRASQVTRSLELFSMLSTPIGSRLTQVVAVENKFPLVGKISLESMPGAKATSEAPQLSLGKVWIDQDLRDALGLQVGAVLKIGASEFLVDAVISDDTSNTWKGISLAPRVFIRLEDVAGTALLKKGSTLWDRTYAVLKPDLRSRDVAKNWNASSSDSSLRATPHEESSEQVAKLTSYLNDYLGLVGLTTLFLALIGLSFLFQTELRRRLRMIGTLRALGDSVSRIGFEIALEALLLGVISAVVSIGVVALTLPFATHQLAKISGVGIRAAVSPVSSAFTLGVGALLGFFLALPFIVRVSRLKVSSLFQDEANLEIPQRKVDIFTFTPLALLFYFLAVYHAHSWRVGSAFFLLAILSISGLYLLGLFVLRRLEKVRTTSLSLRLGLRSLARNPWSSLAGFVSIGAGTLLLCLIPSLQSMIESEISRPEGSKVPSLFLFDIQPEQLEAIKHDVEGLGAHLEYVSPMIRARLESLKGKPVDKALEFSERSTREQEEEEKSRNRGFNLSYREGFADSESLVSGRGFRGRFQSVPGEVPEVTLEDKFADRLGVGIGDRIGFDVQGIPIEAVVVGIRRVRWASFQPNFFVIFQPGVLDDAPKTFLAGVPALDVVTRQRIQVALVKRYPNVALIRVDEMVKKLLKIFDQMGMAVKITALLSLITGILVIFTIARRQVEIKRRGALLLRTIGASSQTVLGIFMWEFGTLALIAASAGAAFSFLISKVLAWFLFDRVEFAVTATSVIAVAAVVLVVLVAVILASFRVVREKPWRILQAEGDR
ncbi:MAG: FtsX-like permease family protein [Cryobacterium sp.]|nr:FtsX-like permease family protein [Oligoflexia bacterium]